MKDSQRTAKVNEWNEQLFLEKLSKVTHLFDLEELMYGKHDKENQSEMRHGKYADDFATIRQKLMPQVYEHVMSQRLASCAAFLIRREQAPEGDATRSFTNAQLEALREMAFAENELGESLHFVGYNENRKERGLVHDEDGGHIRTEFLKYKGNSHYDGTKLAHEPPHMRSLIDDIYHCDSLGEVGEVIKDRVQRIFEKEPTLDSN